MKKAWILIIVVALPMAACKRENAQTVASQTLSTAASAPSPGFDPQSVARGEQLYQTDCAQCHGPQAQGHPDWRTPSNGEFTAAPPLNGTGNDWKRTREELIHTIKIGAQLPDGTPIMPAWKGRLSDAEINDIVAWFQSLWPPQVYEKWSRTNADKVPKS